MCCGLLTYLLLVSCATSRLPTPPQSTDVTIACCSNTTAVHFQYLGNGGWLIRGMDTALLTSPFFSNPPIWRVALSTIAPNRSRIETCLRRVDGLDAVGLILVGHSHYDHLMDLPIVLEHVPTSASILGDITMTNTLAFTRFVTRTAELVSTAGDFAHSGRWSHVRGIRVMAFLSEHASHFYGVKFYSGHYVRPLRSPPTHAADWKEGEPLAFLIDLLGQNGNVVFRIYYDDAAHNFPYGFPDPKTLAEHRVDAAILTVASFQEVADYPDALLRYLRPRYVLLGHWEDFFTAPDKCVRPVRFTDLAIFLKRMRESLPADGAWILPDRFVKIVFGGSR